MKCIIEIQIKRMEFPFNCDKEFGSDSEGYAILDSSKLRKTFLTSKGAQVIDIFGELSAKVLC